MQLLFVCTGNICRSPTAERLARALGQEAGIVGLEPSSAGTRAVIGHPMHDYAASVLRSLGGDPSGFTARQLTTKIASNADIVVTMTLLQRDLVLQQAPRMLRRTFTLHEAARLASRPDAHCISDLAGLRHLVSVSTKDDIPDPIGRGPEVFERVGVLIAGLLPPLLELCRSTAREI
ncbi:hypothetical protein BST22_22155 [Mycolicibacterium chubuense]|nr:protein-tyrosine-phosphatase [Mycolicibacterium chubuense]ORA46329.1 hypothetical protein BST22_22155 [Mycolicibacterium chubuense]